MDRPVAVLGFGKTGQAVLEHLLAQAPAPALLLFTDEPVGDAGRRLDFERRGVRFLDGAAAFASLACCRLAVISPGFDGRQPRFAALRAAGVEVVSEIEFAFRRLRGRAIAVSGSNGKSTTVSLIQHLLSAAGLPCRLAGNIGVPLIAEVDAVAAGSWVVLELSSFQLEEIDRFRPEVAALLNITPDHLDRYASLAEYAAAKLNLFRNQREGDWMVLNADDPRLADAGRLGRGRPLWFSASRRLPRGAFAADGHIVLALEGGQERIPLRLNPLRGVHNLENVLAAALACRAAGLDAAAIAAGLPSFRGLAHRMEAAGRVGAVEFINDSKATNVDAALKSVSSIDGDLVVILGGKDKGGDFTALAEPLRRRARRVLLLGAAAAQIAAQLQALGDKLAFVADLGEAVARGYAELGPGGGTVLLAPACASFDMFANFEARGEAFKREVARLAAREGRHG